MKLFSKICAGVGLLGAMYVTTAYALPVEREVTRYYDANGVQVGYSEQGCYGRTIYMGIITDYYEIETSSCGIPPPRPPGPFYENCGWGGFPEC